MARKAKKRFGTFQHNALTNPCQTLLANIRFSSVDNPIKTLCITSSLPDEGKSTVSSNLCCAMAASGKRVLLIDADMRRRSLGKMMGVHPKYGMYAVLSGSATPKEAIVPTRVSNLYFLDNEPNVPNPSDILSSKRFSKLLESLRGAFDYIVIDMPPIGLFVDAAVVSNQVDGTLLCVRQHATKRDVVQNSVQQLKAAGANLLGVVMTFTKNTENEYYYQYYNEENKRSRKGKTSTPTIQASSSDRFESAVAKEAKARTVQEQSRLPQGREVPSGKHAAAKQVAAKQPSGSYAPQGFKSGK